MFERGYARDMTIEFQPSLLDSATVGVGPIAAGIERTELSSGAWVDVLPGWFEGADDLFTELVECDSVARRAATDVRQRGRRASAAAQLRRR